MGKQKKKEPPMYPIGTLCVALKARISQVSGNVSEGDRLLVIGPPDGFTWHYEESVFQPVIHVPTGKKMKWNYFLMKEL